MTAHVVTLGTAGGPRWWTGPDGRPRSGIATAVVVGDAAYVVDLGQGAGRQLAAAGIGLERVQAVFLTHLHSDHVADLAPLLLFAPFVRAEPGLAPIAVHGPGPRGGLPPASARATTALRPVCPERPTPGTREMVEGLVAAFATDLNDRVLDALAPPPSAVVAGRDIALPEGLGFDPDTRVAPDMEPVQVHADDAVTVTAVLVEHHPMAPAFAFRLDTAAGSVTVSGDTAPCDNLVRLAQGTDLLLHEAIDLDGMVARNPDLEGSAAMDHHRRSHTTPRAAGEIATRAGARALALHHLVPASAPPEVWLRARETFTGPVLVPDDLERIPLARP